MVKGMLLLTVDTSTSYVVAGLVRLSSSDATMDLIASVVHDEPRGHMELLTPSIMQCLADAGLTTGDVDAVIVGEGPGPFTGLRVGMATGAAFGQALGIPVHGVPSLAAIAATVRREHPEAIAELGAGAELTVITDARRREWYHATYSWSEGGTLRTVSEPAVSAPADVDLGSGHSAAGGARGVAAAKAVAPAVASAGALLSEDAWPSPLGLADAALSLVGNAAALRQPGAPLRALYLRRPDAVEPKKKERPAAVDYSRAELKPATEGGEGTPAVVRLDASAAPRLAEIEAVLFEGDSPWPVNGFIYELTRDNTIYLGLVDDNGQILGYAGLARNGAPDDPEWEIHTVGITPEHHGKGWAHLLIRPLMEEVDRVGGPVFLEVRTDNDPAIGLYTTYGFEVTGTRKGYYQPSGADAFTMMRADRQSIAGAENTVESAAGEHPRQDGSTLVMGVESSCDETGVGVVELRADGSVRTIANAVASSMDQHARFGGVVPEIASRAHLEAMGPTMDAALEQMREAGVGGRPDAVAATVGPGLAGALLVGAAAAKAYAAAWGVPFYGVNHLGGHVAVESLGEKGAKESDTGMDNAIALLVSGGHTQILHVQGLGKPMTELGSTLDDAAGEAYDKVARLLGLGYPGGPVIDKLAAQGDSSAIAFPRGMMRQQDSRYDFSFSGLKTAVARYVEQAGKDGAHDGAHDGTARIPIEDVCASFQEAVVDVLTAKALRACEDTGAKVLLLGGGVAANRRLRELAAERCAAAGVELRIPDVALCTDNGVMIAALTAQLIADGAQPSGLGVATDPGLEVETPLVASNEKKPN